YHERARHEIQMQVLQRFQEAAMQLQQATEARDMQARSIIEQAQSLPQDSPDVGTMVQQAQQVAGQPLPPPPVPPPWMADGKMEPDPPQKEPIYMFAHGVCLEPMIGNLGIGL